MRKALTRLYALGPGRMLSGRDRLLRLLKHAGDPHLAVPSVLVGGTNGKGSVVAVLSSILSTEMKTAAFLKPHLKSIRERWRINDEPCTEAQFIKAATEACDLIDRHDEPISFFEANVLLGALLFRDEDCEIAIWEVGLGGKHDACNLNDPMVSILTNVGYDHQATLGESLAEIARDKAHIAREGCPLLLGTARPGWEDTSWSYTEAVEQVAARLGAEFELVDCGEEERWDDWMRGEAGEIAPDTMDIAMAGLGHLIQLGYGPTIEGIVKGAEGVHYRARMERATLRGAPVLLDAAHNVDSLKWLVKVVQARHQSTSPVLFGCQATRDPIELLSILRPIISSLTPVEIPVLHPCPIGELVAAANQLDIPLSLPVGIDTSATPRTHEIGTITELDPPDNSTGWIECVEHALSLATAERPLIICGSIYNLGEILRVFE